MHKGSPFCIHTDLNVTTMADEDTAKKRVGVLPAGLAGTGPDVHSTVPTIWILTLTGTGPNGSFFEPPAWVDQKKAPGTTSQVCQCFLFLRKKMRTHHSSRRNVIWRI